MSTASTSPARLCRSVWRALSIWCCRFCNRAEPTNASTRPAPTGRSCSVAATGCPTNTPRRGRAGSNGEYTARRNREADMQFAGKVVLVTGAQQGIGRAMALEFAAVGADVAINWLDDEGTAERVAEEVGARGRRAILVQGDVAQIEQVHAMVSATEERLGPVDVLVNNAG